MSCLADLFVALNCRGNNNAIVNSNSKNKCTCTCPYSDNKLRFTTTRPKKSAPVNTNKAAALRSKKTTSLLHSSDKTESSTTVRILLDEESSKNHHNHCCPHHHSQQHHQQQQDTATHATQPDEQDQDDDDHDHLHIGNVRKKEIITPQKTTLQQYAYMSNHVVVNQERQSRGIAPLMRCSILDEMARGKAQQMATENRILPAYTSATMVENVFCGPSLPLLHQLIMHSDTPDNNRARSHILDERFVKFGMGTAKGPHGCVIYVSQLFQGGLARTTSHNTAASATTNANNNAAMNASSRSHVSVGSRHTQSSTSLPVPHPDHIPKHNSGSGSGSGSNVHHKNHNASFASSLWNAEEPLTPSQEFSLPSYNSSCMAKNPRTRHVPTIDIHIDPAILKGHRRHQQIPQPSASTTKSKTKTQT